MRTVNVTGRVVVVGEINGIRSGEYQGKKYASLQFVVDLGDGVLRLVEVNMPDNFNMAQFEAGQNMEVEVDVRAKDSRVSYRYKDHQLLPSAKVE